MPSSSAIPLASEFERTDREVVHAVGSRRRAVSNGATRIAVREASARLYRRRAHSAAAPLMTTDPIIWSDRSERDAFNEQIGRLLETLLAELPEILRSVVVLRDVMELDTAETAHCLGIEQEAVRTRLHRGRSELARRLAARAPEATHAIAQVWSFAGERCASMLRRVIAAITAM
ncbi:MAG: sigma factor-like helix-turn-helix DNA-binding protein [Kofleriaceae bacterium]